MPATRLATTEQLLRFFETDALCVRSPAPVLAREQAEAWDPLLQWCAVALGGRPAASDSLFGPAHPPQAVSALRAALAASDDWELAGITAASAACRSLVMAFALARGRVRPAAAQQLLRLEEDAQMREWGYVEGGHDVDEADLRARVGAAAAYFYLLRA